MSKASVDEAIKDVGQFGSKQEQANLKLFFTVLKSMGHKNLIIASLSNWEAQKQAK